MIKTYSKAIDEAIVILLDAMLKNDAPIRKTGGEFDRQFFILLVYLGRKLLEKFTEHNGSTFGSRTEFEKLKSGP